MKYQHTHLAAPSSRLPLLRFSAALFALFAFSAARADTLSPIRLRVGAKEVVTKIAPLTDGRETFLPFEALLAVGARGEVSQNEDAITVTVKATQKRREIALTRLRGKPMLPLSELARLLQADVLYGGDDKTSSDKAQPSGNRRALLSAASGIPLPQAPRPTPPKFAALLARVTRVRFEDNALRIVTSFPIPYRVRTLTNDGPLRGYVDLMGASLPEKLEVEEPQDRERRALGLRVGQNAPEIARVVVDLAEGWGLKAADSVGNTSLRIVAGLDTLPAEIVRARAANPYRLNPTQEANAERVQPAKRIETPPAAASAPPKQGNAVGTRPKNPAVQQNPTMRIQLPPTPENAAPTENPMANGTPPVPKGTAPQVIVTPPPVEITDLTFDMEDERRVRLQVATSRKVKMNARYQPGATQLIVDIPNAKLNLREADRATQSYSNALVTGLHAEQVQESPALTRITLDMTRVLGFSTGTEENRATVDLRLPRNATGPLAGKLVVIDPGHGGSSSGAPGGGGVYEKNIVLAISLKLRAALEACGVNVVMTREKDDTVPLYDRPRRANDVNADFFISIHNDSVSRRNSASGTSTYYHMGDSSSRALAVCIQQAIVGISGLPSRGALSDGVLYENGLAVLRASKMPAVLVEVAYINNDRDRAKLINAEFQQQVALAITRGLRRYVEGAAPAPASNQETGEDPSAESEGDGAGG